MKTLTKASVTATYVYNALGQLIKQSGGPSGTVLYMYDEASHLAGEYTSTGALIQETVWLGDTPIATLRPNGAGAMIYYVHTDHLNTPRRITRPSDNMLIWTWYASPFGSDGPNENPASAGTFKYNLRFAGQVYDPHGGLHQNYFRDYDPLAGRYIESDPVGLPGGINTFAYALNSPLHFIDPLGLDPAMCRTALRTAGGLLGGRIGFACGCALGAAAGGTGGTLAAPGVGTIGGAAVGCGAIGSVAGGVGAAAGALAGDKIADEICSDEENDCSKASPWQLMKAGISDAHEFKTDYGAVPNSRFDICACKDGSIVIKAVGGCGAPGPSMTTHARWK
jgi:RHS repeat-associated protein